MRFSIVCILLAMAVAAQAIPQSLDNIRPSTESETVQEADKNDEEPSGAVVAGPEVTAVDSRALDESARNSTEAVQEPVVNVTESALNLDTQQQSNKKNRPTWKPLKLREEEAKKAETSAVEPSAAASAAEDDATEESPTEEPAPVQDPTADEAAKKDPTADEAAKKDPTADETAKKDPAADEAAKKDPVEDEGAKNEPAADEVVKNEPVAEEAAEEAVTDEAATEETVPVKSTTAKAAVFIIAAEAGPPEPTFVATEADPAPEEDAPASASTKQTPTSTESAPEVAKSAAPTSTEAAAVPVDTWKEPHVPTVTIHSSDGPIINTNSSGANVRVEWLVYVLALFSFIRITI